jgi:hypothetical protein
MVTIDKTSITVTKLEAAQRQLRTAIRLWFADADPVSVHTLGYAAYEIIHAVSKRLNPNRRDLLFDSLSIKEEYRGEIAMLLKKHANFFKHANKAGEDVIEFHPVTSHLFLLFSIIGLEVCGQTKSTEEWAFVSWMQVHHPEFLTEKGREVVANAIPIDRLAELRLTSKSEFLECIYAARRLLSVA